MDRQSQMRKPVAIERERTKFIMKESILIKIPTSQKGFQSKKNHTYNKGKKPRSKNRRGPWRVEGGEMEKKTKGGP